MSKIRRVLQLLHEAGLSQREAARAALGWVSRTWRKRFVMARHFSDNPASGDGGSDDDSGSNTGLLVGGAVVVAAAVAGGAVALRRRGAAGSSTAGPDPTESGDQG